MADMSKTANKFDLQKIIGDVKAMISPVVIPEANKNDPVGYCLSELSKLTKDLAESHSKQADTIAKISTMLGTLHQEITNSRKVPDSVAASPASKTEEKK
jgi:hypothetical protein